MIYDDVEAGKQGKRLVDKLAAYLGDGWELGDRVWSVQVLGIPELRNRAASAAAAADLVIFSLSGREDLSQEFKEWIEMWLWLIDQTDPAVVAVVGHEGRRAEQFLNFLRPLIRKNGLDFVTNSRMAEGAPLSAIGAN